MKIPSICPSFHSCFIYFPEQWNGKKAKHLLDLLWFSLCECMLKQLTLLTQWRYKKEREKEKKSISCLSFKQNQTMRMNDWLSFCWLCVGLYNSPHATPSHVQNEQIHVIRVSILYIAAFSMRILCKGWKSHKITMKTFPIFIRESNNHMNDLRLLPHTHTHTPLTPHSHSHCFSFFLSLCNLHYSHGWMWCPPTHTYTIHRHFTQCVHCKSIARAKQKHTKKTSNQSKGQL